MFLAESIQFLLNRNEDNERGDGGKQYLLHSFVCRVSEELKRNFHNVQKEILGTCQQLW